MLVDSKKPKVLIVITKPNFGGAQRYVFEIAEHLKNKDIPVSVATGGTGELTERLESISVPVNNLSGLERDINLKSELRALWSLFKLIRNERPDILHLNSSKAGVLGAMLSRLLRVPKVVFTAHGWPFLEERSMTWRAVAWLGSWLTAALSHQVIAVSYNDKHHTPWPFRYKTNIIRTAISDYPLIERQAAREALVPKELIEQHLPNTWLLSIGELNKNKNQSVVIDAIATFNQEHHHKIFYVIIGEGELRNVLEEQIDLRGLRDHVYLTGHLKEARNYLLAGDIFILPSLKEGLPYALLEAGKAGLPVIASAVGGCPEVVAENQTGLLINPHQPNTISDALEKMINNPEMRHHLSQELSSLLHSDYNLNDMLSKTTELYFSS
jgi:glycosyltransferase involved in cell wall biosynthesis